MSVAIQTAPVVCRPSIYQTGQMVLVVVLLQAPTVASAFQPQPKKNSPSTVVAAQAGPLLPFNVSRQLMEWLSDTAVARPSISHETVMRAAAFASGLPALASVPHLGASDDGDIGLTWYNGDDRFSASIDAEALAWTTKIKGAYIPGYDVEDSDVASFEPVYRALAEFYGINDRAVSV